MISAIEPPKQNRWVLFWGTMEGTEPRSADNTARFLAKQPIGVGHMHNNSVYHSSVFTEHTERRFSAWRTVISPKDLPDEPGCYVVYSHDIPVYVGSAQSLKKRFNTHQLDDNRICGRGFLLKAPYIKYRPSKRFGDWRMVELRLIRRIRPVHNVKSAATKEEIREEIRRRQASFRDGAR